jgi:acetyl esterase/lipase
VTYRLAPEYVFLTAAHDVWDAIKWPSANTALLGAGTHVGFIFGGVSSGANLVAVAAQRAVQEGLSPPFTGVWMCMPCALDKDIVPPEYANVFIPRKQSANALLVDTNNLYSVIEISRSDVFSPDWSPFNIEKPHSGMLPCYIQVSGADPMRDDGLIYERALGKAGSRSSLTSIPVSHIDALDFSQVCRLPKMLMSTLFVALLGKSTGHEDEGVSGAMS